MSQGTLGRRTANLPLSLGNCNYSQRLVTLVIVVLSDRIILVMDCG